MFLYEALLKETIHIRSTVECPSFPSMNINCSDVGGKKACQPAAETLPALYRKTSLGVWKNTGRGWSQIFPGLSVAHQSAGIAWHHCPSSAGSAQGLPSARGCNWLLRHPESRDVLLHAFLPAVASSRLLSPWAEHS